MAFVMVSTHTQSNCIVKPLIEVLLVESYHRVDFVHLCLLHFSLVITSSSFYSIKHNNLNLVFPILISPSVLGAMYHQIYKILYIYEF